MLQCWAEDRLSGAGARPGAPRVAGPPVASWKGQQHRPRPNRRWSTAWSPEQTAGRLPIDFPDDASMRSSHEAIYQALFVQGWGTGRSTLSSGWGVRRSVNWSNVRRASRCCSICHAGKATMASRASRTDRRWPGTAPGRCGMPCAHHLHLAGGTAPVAHLGSGRGVGTARPSQDRCRRAGLFCDP